MSPRGGAVCPARPAGRCFAAGLAAALGLVVALAGSGPACAQEADRRFPITNGDVFGASISGGTMYVCGDFNYIGPATGSFVALDSVTAEADLSGPCVDGATWAMAPDGAGGWIIGGSFEHVSGVPRAGLARIRADGSVDAWNPQVTGEVLALAVVGQTVYVGGNFTSAGGAPRTHLAAVDLQTGLATAWSPNPNGAVQALATWGNRLYACGPFTFIAGQARSSLVAFDLPTGQLTPWNLAPTGIAAHMAIDGSTLYVSGNFGIIGGQPRGGLAAIDLASGLVKPWNPLNNSGVLGFGFRDSTVYVAGMFTVIGGQARKYVAALSATTGLARAWNPNANQIAECIVVNGSTAWVSGAFTAVGGLPRRRFAAIDLVSGLPTEWAVAGDEGASVLQVVGNGRVQAAGAFRSAGGRGRSFLAAVELATGRVTPWNPSPNAMCLALAADGPTVYLGGLFSTLGGVPRAGLAAVDATSGLVTAWNPGLGAPASLGVGSIAVHDSLVYVAGGFSAIGGVGRFKAACVNANTGVVTGWNPVVDAAVDRVYPAGDRVYLAGQFANCGGQPRLRFAVTDTGTGAVLPMNPDFGSGGHVNVFLAGDGVVHAGGFFSTVNGVPRKSLAAFDEATGALLPWDAAQNFTHVYALSRLDSTIYVGAWGDDNTYAGSAALGATSALASAWRARPQALWYGYPDAASLTFIEGLGSRVYVAGDFEYLAGQTLRGIGSLDRGLPAPFAAEVTVPRGGETLAHGYATPLRWAANGPRGIQSADLYLSRSGPLGPWEPIALGVRSAGAYDWTVSEPEVSGSAYVRVDARDWAGNIVSATSPAFSIVSGSLSAGGPAAPSGVFLARPAPSPARGRTSLAFELPARGPVRLGLYDVQGREVLRLCDGERAAGRHVVPFDSGRVAPGLYFLRLSAAGATVSRRLPVVR